MNVFILIGLFVAVMLSGAGVFLLKKENGRLIKLMISFSGAFLFAMSVLRLIPELYAVPSSITGLWILAGFFLQVLLELFSKGIEHGHIHKEEHAHSAFPSAIFISLCIHSFLEGMPLAGSGETNSFYYQLLTGIVLHNIPISIVMMTLLLRAGCTKAISFFWLGIFALMLPVGAIAGALGSTIAGGVEHYHPIALAIVVGIFIHISTTILFESSENHRFNFYKFIAIALGVGAALVN